MFQDRKIELGAQAMYTPLSVNESIPGYTFTVNVKCIL